MFYHSQCLDKQGRKWRHGRAWWRFEKKTISVNWGLFMKSSTALWFERNKYGDPNGYTFHFCIWGILSLFLSIEGFRFEYKGSVSLKESERTIGFSIFSGAIWVYLWTDRSGWGPDRTKTLHYVDWILGKQKYSRETWTEGECMLQMPEGAYKVEYKGCRDTWKRPRWKSYTIGRFDLDLEKGLPVPGKGENPWDCGDDAIFGGTYPADTLAEALDRLVASANRDRLRYGGKNWQPEL